MPVTLINPFRVPPEKEDAFLAMWQETAEAVRHAPGFIGTKLHRSLHPEAEFRFVNVAQWESEAAWKAAFANLRPREIGPGVEAHPALYAVAVEY